MKNIILILISLLLLTVCEPEKEVSKLQERGGVFYEPNSQEGYTGKLVRYYTNGQKWWLM